MTVVNVVIALILVAASWWAVVRLLTWSLQSAESTVGPAPSGAHRILPDNRVLTSFDRPSAPLNQPPVAAIATRANAE